MGFRKFSQHDVESNHGIYNRYSGFRKRKSQEPLNSTLLNELEKVLPCPHDPTAQSVIALKGENKLLLEAESAKRSQELLVLNRQ